MDAGDMNAVAGFVLEALDAAGNDGGAASIRRRVLDFASKFPVPGIS
jgi:glycine/serine hydroxymethyltransferase